MGSTRKPLTDDEMERAFQLDFYTKLLGLNNLILSSIEMSIADLQRPEFEHQFYGFDREKAYQPTKKTQAALEAHKAQKSATEALNQSLKTVINRLSEPNAGSLDVTAVNNINNQINDYTKSTHEFTQSRNQNLYATKRIRSKDPLYVYLDVEDKLPENAVNLLKISHKILDDFKYRNTHALRTEALRGLHDETLGAKGERKYEVMRSILDDKYARKNKSLTTAKLFFKSHFHSSRNHPEMRIIKLLSKFKEGDTSEVHKHNSDLLRKMKAICDNALDPNAKRKPTDGVRSFLETISNASTAALSKQPISQNQIKTTIDEYQGEISKFVDSQKEEDYVKRFSGGFPGKGRR